MGGFARLYGTAAHMLIPVVPVTSSVGTLLTAGRFRPMNAGVHTLNTLTLKEKCKENHKNVESASSSSSSPANLYDFRWPLLDLAYSRSSSHYRLGRVSISIDSKSSTWIVLAHDHGDDNDDEKEHDLKNNQHSSAGATESSDYSEVTADVSD